MKNFNALLKEARINKKLKTRELAELISIDAALISKYENGSRMPSKKQLMDLCVALNLDFNEMLKYYVASKIIYEISEYTDALEILKVAEDSIKYTKNSNKQELNANIKMALKDIDALKSKLNKLRKNDSYRIAQAIELEYTYESNRIEGNTLTLKETDLVINDGMTVSNKSMREHLEAINHAEAIDFLKDLVHKKIQFTESVLLQIHFLILKSIDAQYAGKYRNVQVMIKGSKHAPPQAYMVPKLMEDYFIWYNSNKSKLHPVLLAAEAHERLVTIHPFIDGNGRTARLVMNLILLQHGFVIANIKGDTANKLKYFEVLEEAQVTTNKDSYLDFIAKVEKDALMAYLKIIGG